MKIVIVDDESIICEGLMRILSDSRSDRCEVTAFYHDAEDALENCDWEKVDLLLIDINMPGMGGLEMVDTLRERGWDTLVVIISGFPQFEYARRALRNNAVDFIVKPLCPESILAVIDKAQSFLDARRAERDGKLFLQENLDRLAREFFGELIFETRKIPTEQKTMFDAALDLPSKRYTLFLLAASPSEDFSDLEEAAKRRLDASCYIYPSGTGMRAVLAVYDASRRFDSEGAERVLREECGSLYWIDSVESGDFYSLTQNQSRLFKTIRDLGVAESIQRPHLSDPVQGRIPPNGDLSIPVQEALRIIHEDCSRPLSLSFLAEKTCVHPAYLSSLFKKQTGFALIEYINHYRIEAAKRLLRDPLNKIFWISERVGFANQRYFSQVFKRLTGLTPVEYRADWYLGAHR